MANEHLLKTIVNLLENFSDDCDALGDWLNRRVPNAANHYQRVPFIPPKPPAGNVFPPPIDHFRQAANLMDAVAGRNEDVARLVLHTIPANPGPMPGPVTDEEAMRSIVDWLIVASGSLKTVLRLYGAEPSPGPSFSHPGALSEKRLCAEIVSWLKKISDDSDRFARSQGITRPVPPPPPYSTVPANPTNTLNEYLLRLQQGIRKQAEDLVQMTFGLPSHLKNVP